MTLDRDKVINASKGFRALFMEELEKQEGTDLWTPMSMEVPSTGDSEEYDWAGPGGYVSEWIGDRALEQLKNFAFTVKNRLWKNGLRIRRTHIEDDRLGLYRPQIQMLASHFRLHRTEIAFLLLLNAFNANHGLAYNGQFFIDTDHVDDEETAQSNKGTAKFSTTALDEAIVVMRKFKNSKGKYLNIMPTHGFFPLSLRALVSKVIGNPILLQENAGQDALGMIQNYNKGVVTPVIVPWLEDTPNAWFLMDLSKPIKPFIFQNRMEPEFQALDNLNDPNVFNLDEFQYGGRARYNFAYAVYQLIWGSDGSA